MSAMPSESADAIYSSHTIEHLYPNEIPLAMKEFLRVLKPQGYAVITCPDLQAAAEMIVQDKLMDMAYTTGSGMVVTPLISSIPTVNTQVATIPSWPITAALPSRF